MSGAELPCPGDQRGGDVKVGVVSIQQRSVSGAELPRGPQVWANDFFAGVNLLRARNTTTKFNDYT